MTNIKTIEELEALGYKKLHTSLYQGYISRKGQGYKIEPYKGLYGEGYVVRSCNGQSTRYSFVTYWVK